MKSKVEVEKSFMETHTTADGRSVGRASESLTKDAVAFATAHRDEVASRLKEGRAKGVADEKIVEKFFDDQGYFFENANLKSVLAAVE